MNSLSEEVSTKLQIIRQTLTETDAKGVYLRGTDWFAWVTAGGSNTVLLTAETGIAEVLVTADDAWILTDEIEAQRLKDEELPANFQLYINPWVDTVARENFIREATGGGKILCDRVATPQEYRPTNPTTQLLPAVRAAPRQDRDRVERPTNPTTQLLPASLLLHKRTIMSSELERYREVGRKASIAMTEVLKAAKPTWTEYQLAGVAAEALWSQGLHPALTLVAGERRLPLYRHATPTAEPIGRQAMMVFCARGYGLYANLTRFVSFGVSSENAESHRHVREIETVALEYCKPGVALHEVYQALAGAYQQHGFPNAIKEHHQGGTTGYLAREIIANPTTNDTLVQNMAVAWNPSLLGAKIEDTFMILDGKLENLTFDANFPSVEIEGRLRPVPLEI